ncbi:MAG: cytidylate kinase-like family protein [Lachnospiraceae bacterium]|nr:cytidylate kinase-like family protein [Lachnospiraceae bacterium]MBP5254201.1 cytidylate kinase-like family protein [Lachnospiraceae bacterium]
MASGIDGKLIICIGRESGSGGRKIGMMLAEKLGVNCYARELISVAAENSGLCDEIIASHDERPRRSFLYSLVMDSYSVGYHAQMVDMPMDQKVFLAQYEAIKKLASESGCVFVGRCADYVLQDDPDMVSVFITASEEDKIQTVMETHSLDRAKAKDYIQKTDRRRSSYYNSYSDRRWGLASSYDLCLNRSALGFEGTAEAILAFARLKKRGIREPEKLTPEDTDE